MANYLDIAIQNAKKEKMLSVSNLIVMTFAFLLLGLFLNVIVASQTILRYLEQQAQVTVFFKDDFPQDSIFKLKQDLEKNSKIAQITYVSKEEAFKMFKEINKDEPTLLDSVSSSILPASLVVKTKNISDLAVFASDLRKNDGVEQVRFFEDVIARFKLFSTIIYVVGFVLVGILIIAGYSVVVGSIRMTIHSKGEEFEIMKLVGASDDYVKKPLIAQGVLYCMSSALLSALIIILVNVFVLIKNILPQGYAFGFIHGTHINPVVFAALLSVFLLISGILIGYFSSTSAIKKYLKY